MKNKILIMIIALLAIGLFIAAQSSTPPAQAAVSDIDSDFPDEIVTILKQSCFDCHSSDAGNVKAKAALNFSKWDDYKVTKKINKLTGIAEQVKAKDMPPGKYLDKNPDAVLSDEQITLLTSWASAEADKLMEE